MTQLTIMGNSSYIIHTKELKLVSELKGQFSLKRIMLPLNWCANTVKVNPAVLFRNRCIELQSVSSCFGHSKDLKLGKDPILAQVQSIQLPIQSLQVYV